MDRSDLLPLNKFADPDLRPATHRLSLAMHRTMSRFAKHETRGLTSQIGRCAVTAPGHGAEGWSRRSTNYILRHRSIANGSSEELRCILILTGDLEYCSQDDIAEADSDVDRIGAMTAAWERPPKKHQAG